MYTGASEYMYVRSSREFEIEGDRVEIYVEISLIEQIQYFPHPNLPRPGNTAMGKKNQN